MENSATKKLALLYILEILREMSDFDHPMAQVTVMVEPHNAVELATRYPTKLWLVGPEAMTKCVIAQYALSMAEYHTIDKYKEK